MAVTAACPLRAQQMPPALTQFLQQSIGLTSAEIDAAGSGTAVVKALTSQDSREVAVFGIVSIGVPRTFYVRRATDFASSLAAPRRRFALFGDPPRAADVAAITLAHDDVTDLAGCQPGACTFKMSAEDMSTLRGQLPPAGPAADSAATAFVRRRMLDYVTGYRQHGNTALLAYQDKPVQTTVAQVFESMVSRSPFMYQYAPSLERYLRNYPADRPAQAQEAIYWSEDDLPNLKRTLSITHVVAYTPPELPGCTLIAAKQLYAAHYLDGALDLTAVVDRDADSSGIYLVVLHRLHFDNLPGGVMNMRGRVSGGIRDRTATALRDMKTRTEQAWARRSP